MSMVVVIVVIIIIIIKRRSGMKPAQAYQQEPVGA